MKRGRRKEKKKKRKASEKRKGLGVVNHFKVVAAFGRLLMSKMIVRELTIDTDRLSE